MSSTYTIIRKLAVGGMAQIFLARQESEQGFRRTVVLKRVLPEYCRDTAFVKAFLNEAQLCAQLAHPHIVQVYDVGRQGEEYFVAMEYIRGYDLALLLKTCRASGEMLPIPIVLRIAVDMMEALAFAHQAVSEDGAPLHIIHRDVTPSNIIVAKDGNTKLVDFGIAKAATDAGEKTRTGSLKGKVGYFAPEQIRGKPIDHRVDIFAAGVVMFELLTSKHPFRAETDYDTLMRVVEMPFVPPDALRPDLPAALVPVVAKLLAKDPAERCASALEAVALIETVARESGYGLSHAEVARYLEANAPELERAREALEAVHATRDLDHATSTESAILISEGTSRTESPRRAPVRAFPRLIAIGAAALALGGAIVMGMTRSPPPPAPSAATETAAAPVQGPATAPAVTAAPAVEVAPAPAPALPQKAPKPATKERPKPPSRAREPAPVRTSQEMGTLRIVVLPWGNVSVDRRAIGVTPLSPIELSAGEHDVHIVNEELGKNLHKKVRVVAGETNVLRVSLDKE